MEKHDYKVGKVKINMMKPKLDNGVPALSSELPDKISKVDVGKGLKEKYDYKQEDIFEGVTKKEKIKKNNKPKKVQPKVLKKISQKKY